MVRIIILGRNVAFGVPHPQIEYLFSCGTASSVNGPDKSDQNIKSSVIIYHTLPANASILAVSDSNEFYQTSIKPRNKTIFKILLYIYCAFFRITDSALILSYLTLLFFLEKMLTIATQHVHWDHLIPDFTRGHSLSPNHVRVNIYNLFNKRSPLEKRMKQQ